MDNLSPDFQEAKCFNTDELCQYFSPISCHQHTIPKDEVLLAPADKDENPNDRKKKILRRDIERQRSQEMATLCRSLRSLLPRQNLKGKKSTSDLIQQTVNYIKQLEEKVQELSYKRDELKILSNSSNSSSSAAVETMENCKRDTLTVKYCCVGVAVVMDTVLTKGFPLSKVLEVLIQEGLSIVSCFSSQVNGRMFHIIKSEVSDGRSIEITELEQKLKNSITWFGN